MVTLYADLPDERTASLAVPEPVHSDYCDCGGDVDRCTFFHIPYLNLEVRTKH